MHNCVLSDAIKKWTVSSFYSIAEERFHLFIASDERFHLFIESDELFHIFKASDELFLLMLFKLATNYCIVLSYTHTCCVLYFYLYSIDECWKNSSIIIFKTCSLMIVSSIYSNPYPFGNSFYYVDNFLCFSRSVTGQLLTTFFVILYFFNLKMFFIYLNHFVPFQFLKVALHYHIFLMIRKKMMKSDSDDSVNIKKQPSIFSIIGCIICYIFQHIKYNGWRTGQQKSK